MAVNKDDAMNMAATPAKEAPAIKRPNFIVKYLREVLAELKKTNWPTRNELTKSTLVVIITIFIVAVYLYISDAVASQFMRVILGTS